MTAATELVMSDEKISKTRIAVVGSGLAGLTAAYLLHNDSQQRFRVTVFESGPNLSLNSASVELEHPGVNEGRIRVDVPMRAFTGGYYRNLMAMYDHLGIRYHWQRFRFEFCKYAAPEPISPYFVHASDNHEFPPPRPSGKGNLAHVVDVVIVTLCFLWLMLCCSFVQARSFETVDGYLHRIRMPGRFISRYLLPLMSAIATCSHQEILGFPASDVVQYRKLTRGHKQYVVTHGIKEVQEALVRGIDIRCRTRILRIDPDASRVKLWSERYEETGQTVQESHSFDHVITAVPPNVVAEIFEPARSQLARIPVRKLETIVHRSPTRRPAKMPDTGSDTSADRILLKTSNVAGGWTEATHVRPDGVAVTSCPIAPFSTPDEVLARSTFVRTLRTPESRQIIRKILRQDGAYDRTLVSESKAWRNGDLGVFVAGAWVYDGMVLLEGAVSSAMAVANAFAVEIPWRS